MQAILHNYQTYFIVHVKGLKISVIANNMFILCIIYIQNVTLPLLFANRMFI